MVRTHAAAAHPPDYSSFFAAAAIKPTHTMTTIVLPTGRQHDRVEHARLTARRQSTRDDSMPGRQQFLVRVGTSEPRVLQRETSSDQNTVMPGRRDEKAAGARMSARTLVGTWWQES